MRARRLGLTVLLSTGLHLGAGLPLLLLVGKVSAPEAARVRPAAFDLDLSSLASTPAAPPARPAAPAPSPAALAPAVPNHAAPEKRAPPSRRGEPSRGRGAARAPARRPSAPEISPAEGESFSLKMRAPDLSLDRLPAGLESAPADEPSTEAPPVRRGSRSRPSGPASKEETARRLQQIFDEDRAVDDVRTGRVSPHLYDLVREAEERFKPTWDLTKGDARRVGAIDTSFKSFIRSIGRNWQQALEEQRDAVRERQEKKEEPPSLLDYYDLMRRVAEDAADLYSAELCASIAPGRPSDVKVVRSSQRPRFDALAQNALEKAVDARPAPAGTAAVRACYNFTARFSRVPPIPVVGCNFDEVKLTLDCFYPTKKVLKVSVRLLSAHPI
jgi:hypothetical protein